jgi:histidinol-phosphate aminotransferase
MFYQCAQIVGNKIITPSYDNNGSFPTQKVLQSIKKGVKLIVICNPNNPTGTAVSLEAIEKIVKKAFKFNAIVYVDEAYFEFCKITAAGLIKKYPNLIITRTFSKAFGLASLRIGYVLSSAENIIEMLKIRGPYDVNMPAVVAASAALDDLKSLEKYVNKVMNKAKPLLENYFKKNNIKFLPSSANFLLFKMENPLMHSEKLKKLGFLTRPREGKGSEGTIRVTIGTVSQMKKFINQFKNA